jgi:hypothetical protein
VAPNILTITNSTISARKLKGLLSVLSVTLNSLIRPVLSLTTTPIQNDAFKTCAASEVMWNVLSRNEDSTTYKGGGGSRREISPGGGRKALLLHKNQINYKAMPTTHDCAISAWCQGHWAGTQVQPCLCLSRGNSHWVEGHVFPRLPCFFTVYLTVTSWVPTMHLQAQSRT